MIRNDSALLERMTLPDDAPQDVVQEPAATLSAVLNWIGVVPFSDASVARYKEAKQREANKWLWLHRRAELAVFLSVVCMGAGLGLLFYADKTRYGMPFQPSVLLWVGLAAMFLGACVLVSFASGLIRVKDRAIWEVVPLLEYEGKVPAVAEATLCEVEANLPAATFWVHRLVQNRRVVDPFMEARCGGESYFIAVWDETYAAQ